MDRSVGQSEQPYEADDTSQEQASVLHTPSAGQPKRRWFRWVLVGAGVLIALELVLIAVLTRPDVPTEEELRAMLPAIGRSGEVNSTSDGQLVGQPAPDFTLKTMTGKEMTLSDLHGRPVLINFWASWCPPCRQEIPELVRAYRAHSAEGFLVLAVNLTFQDSMADVEAFVREFALPFPVLLDESGDVAKQRYRLRAVPMSIFVDRDGTITRVYVGEMSGEQIDQFVDEILP